MPLPPSLAAKLAKRGIFPSPTPAKPVKHDTSIAMKGYDCCPNKYNIYHQCERFCVTRWKLENTEPKRQYVRKKNRMLRRYPLPSNWREAYDRGCSSFYFWDVDRNVVSWYPPKHPKAKITRSAAKLREERIARDKEREKRELAKVKIEQREYEEKEYRRERSSRYRRGDYRRHRDDLLDPMDPASYSDIPRGSWSMGLDTRGEARTGVDSTVSGPLYQSRPYPSPGAVLAANRSKSSR